jgi:hypothetical protein
MNEIRYEPTELAQGESVKWQRRAVDYPANLWDAQYRFRALSGDGYGADVDCTESGDAFEAVLTSAQSAQMSPGLYEAQLWVTSKTDAQDVRQIDSIRVQVRSGFVEGDLASVDLRTTSRQILDAIDAMLVGKATADQMEFTIQTQVGQRALKRIPMAELIQARTYYAGVVAREEQAERLRRRGGVFKNIYVRMREDG